MGQLVNCGPLSTCVIKQISRNPKAQLWQTCQCLNKRQAQRMASISKLQTGTYFVSLNLELRVKFWKVNKWLAFLKEKKPQFTNLLIPSFCNIFKRNLAQIQIILVSKQANEKFDRRTFALLLECPEAFEMLKLALNIQTMKHRNVINIYVHI